MSDAAATDRPSGTLGRSPPSFLTDEAVEALLADFRDWLLGIGSQTTENREQDRNLSCPPSPAVGLPASDLFALVAQFTALRHEVNMQTRAARAAVEQNSEILRQFESATDRSDAGTADDDLRSVARAVIDIADALALSLDQIERVRDTAEPLLAELAASSSAPVPAPGFLARLFGAGTPSRIALKNGARTRQALDKLQTLAAAAADGYAMSLRRVQRLLPTLELEPLACDGEEYDPESMEVVEVVDAAERAPGTVVEEVRPGYLWRGKILRYAQVKVAR